MLVKINGAAGEVADGCSVRDVLIARGIRAELAIITVNGEIVKRETWDGTRLYSNDEVEIIRIIGGG